MIQTADVPVGWLADVVELLFAMAADAITIDECKNPADLMTDIASHLGLDDHTDSWTASVEATREDAELATREVEEDATEKAENAERVIGSLPS